MIRTQIQLTEDQHERLRELAGRHNLSISELIRRSLSRVLDQEAEVSPQDRLRRAVAAAGRFASGRRDVSGKHDEHLAEAYKQ